MSIRKTSPRILVSTLAAFAILGTLDRPLAAAQKQQAIGCTVAGVNRKVVRARVVALDTAIMNNRFGAQVPGGMIYALANDVAPTDGANPNDWTTWNAGAIALKDYKRARPMVLRVNKNQCLQVLFRNLLNPTTLGLGDTFTREAGVFLQGMEWVRGPQDDASWVGANTSSLVAPGNAAVNYVLFAREEGPFLLYSTGDDYTGGNAACSPGPNTSPPPVCPTSSGPNLSPSGGDGGQLTQGLFGAVMVQPERAEYYRSQVNHQDLCLASTDANWSKPTCKRTNPNTPPQIHYQATYPADHDDRPGLPVLNMLDGNELVHSDLTAVITGPEAGRWPPSDLNKPEFHTVGFEKEPTYPDRLEPYREFTIIYHELLRSAQAFSDLYQDAQLKDMLEAGGDNFAINYGMGGIASEIIANRLEVGPASDCTDCKYEEFFLSSWPNGDPAMIVDNPADNGCQEAATGGFPTYNCDSGHSEATQAFYPDDPSNVYHTYLWDHTKFRILHGGVALHHLHHLHAHQWLGSPNTSKGHYLDSQAIGPGSAFTLETVYNGGGNKNLTVGDSIFHCHFYPHFAAGMWALWRVHDTFENGTVLESYPQGRPEKDSRAQPDGEIRKGTPIPALVPMPTKAMAPIPAPVRLTPGGKNIEVCQGTQSNPVACVNNLTASGVVGQYKNPGYPFFIPGVGGSRAAHPPKDFACDPSQPPCVPLDGGLPRHVMEPGGVTHAPGINPLDFSKDVEQADGVGLPEQGTFFEQVAMRFHAQRTHPSVKPDGTAANYTTNGNDPVAGAPYAEPCQNLEGKLLRTAANTRNYWAADIQTEAVYNKEGWHYPQQRMISLWGDAFDFMGLNPANQQKAPEPFFFRANSEDCVKYRLANLIPKSYELDDFQVRTPTDVLGQHIHLVKFDVTSSDGAANGYNYEDGTLAPDEVVERINAFNNGSFATVFGGANMMLAPDFIKFFGADPSCAPGQGGNPTDPKCSCRVVEFKDNGGSKFSIEGGRWCGSQATVQLWYVDPQLIDTGSDRTMRTVFTHDHFSPSTHQQTGLYAGLVAEPKDSKWLDNQSGATLGNRTATQNGINLKDGGPTSWMAVIQTRDERASYREFLIEFQDTTLMYRPFPDYVSGFLPMGCLAGQACGFCSTNHSQACSTNAASKIYTGKVCEPITLPNRTAGDDPSELEPSCNFIAGIPSNNSLFSSESNVWGVTSGPQFDALRMIGWDTWPIGPPRSGLFVQGVQGTPTQPEVISFNGGTWNFSVNYRNEPVYSRINSTTTSGNNKDLAFVYQSLSRTLPGQQPPTYAPLTAGVGPNDPFTPLLRAYSGDDVQIRVLVGAHQNPHNFTIHDTRWLFEPTNVNSGWRNNQTMGISEHFEFLLELPPVLKQPKSKDVKAFDYLYKPTAAKQGQASGNWGLMRAYNGAQASLHPLPQNPPGAKTVGVCPAGLMSGSLVKPCGTTDANGHQVRCYTVVATRAEDVLGTRLTYNTKKSYTSPNSLIYMHEVDFNRLNNNQPVPGFDKAKGLAEPLILRAAAGDCIRVTLKNKLKKDTYVGTIAPDQSQIGNGFSSAQLPVEGVSPTTKNLYVFDNASPSRHVGLRPQGVTYNVAFSDGSNVGINPAQTAAPGKTVTYFWYAGNIDANAPVGQQHIPIEFGAANLLSPDPINHHAWGLFGGLVIEPEGSQWVTDPNSRASATVRTQEGSFREVVLILQDDIYMVEPDDKNPGQIKRRGLVGGFNYRIERPVDRQTNCLPDSNNVSCVLSESLGGPIETPIFCSQAGTPTRFRLLHPGGAVTNHVFELHGHVFAEEPYSTTPAANCSAPITQANLSAAQKIEVANQCPDGTVTLGPSLTEWKASRMGHGPTNHFDLVVKSAGGENKRAGDYLYRSYPSVHFKAGTWGVFRVTPAAPTAKACPSFATPASGSN